MVRRVDRGRRRWWRVERGDHGVVAGGSHPERLESFAQCGREQRRRSPIPCLAYLGKYN